VKAEKAGTGLIRSIRKAMAVSVKDFGVGVIHFIRRYRWWILSIILVTYCLAYAHLLDYPIIGGGPVSFSNYDRIKIGMTEEEVAKILRGPGQPAYRDKPWTKFWMGRTGHPTILVDFDEKAGTVKRKEFID
jgi:hypothetical protein